MRVSYNKLWKLLIDKRMKRVELRDLACISTCTLAKLGKDENVTMEILKKICKTLRCNVGDIMDILPDEDDENQGDSPKRRPFSKRTHNTLKKQKEC